MRIRLAALVIAAAGLVAACGGGGTEKPDSWYEGNQDRELQSCPDRLEVRGPFVDGIDPEYDPAMDWDGDGVSCE